MRIEISAGGLPSVMAVQEYQSNMQAFSRDMDTVISCFKSIQKDTYSLAGGVDGLQSALDEVSLCLQEENGKKDATELVRNKTNDFLELAIRVDKQVAVEVNKNKNEFYRINPWLKPPVPEREKEWYEQAWDWLCGKGEEIVNGIKDAWNWVTDTVGKIWNGLVEFYNEYKKIIDSILIVIGAALAIGAVIATGGLALAPLLGAIGFSASTAAIISGTVAVIAVVSTVGASAMNLIDTWCDIDNPLFNAIQKGLNIVSTVSNLAYNIGTIYNSIKKINPKAYVQNNKTVTDISQLSGKEVQAITDYSGEDYYRNINNSLRGSEVATPKNAETIKTMDGVLNKSALQNDMTLYRGTSQEALGNLQGLSPEELVGKTFVEKGYMSTTSSSEVAKAWTKNMHITIDAAKGSHAIDISQISKFPWEKEILFARNQEMMITSAKNVNGILNIGVILK